MNWMTLRILVWMNRLREVLMLRFGYCAVLCLTAFAINLSSCTKSAGTPSRKDGAYQPPVDDGAYQPPVDISGRKTYKIDPSTGAILTTTGISSSDPKFTNVTVAIPAGALSIPTDVSIFEAHPLLNLSTASAVGSSNLTAAGPAVAVLPSQSVAISGSLVISLPYSALTSLTGGKQLLVIAVYPGGASGNELETFVGSELDLNTSGIVKLSTNRFGAFQVVFSDSPIEKKKIQTSLDVIPVADSSRSNSNQIFKAPIFGGNIPITWKYGFNHRTAILGDNKILIPNAYKAVGSSDADSSYLPRLTMINSKGELVTRFGTNGHVVISNQQVPNGFGIAVAVDDQNKRIYFAGAINGQEDGFLAAMNFTGRLIPSFGTGGIILFPYRVTQVEVVSGKIYVNYFQKIERINFDGSKDSSFSGDPAGDNFVIDGDAMFVASYHPQFQYNDARIAKLDLATGAFLKSQIFDVPEFRETGYVVFAYNGFVYLSARSTKDNGSVITEDNAVVAKFDRDLEFVQSFGNGGVIKTDRRGNHETMIPLAQDKLLFGAASNGGWLISDSGETLKAGGFNGDFNYSDWLLMAQGGSRFIGVGYGSATISENPFWTCQSSHESASESCFEEIPGSIVATKSRRCNASRNGFEYGPCIQKDQPELTVTSDVVGSITNGTNLNLTFTFSEPVADFDVSDVVLTNATKGSFSIENSKVYKLVVSPINVGSFSISVPANKGTDEDGFGNKASNVLEITFDNVPPQSPVISINSGASYTNLSKVSLDLSASDASQMYITNTAGCSAGGSWETYATSKSNWNLAQANSTARVYVKYKDVAGNESTCVSDTIVHDSIAPLIPVIFHNSRAFNASFSTSLQQNSTVDTNFKEFRHTFNDQAPSCVNGIVSSTAVIPAATTTLKVVACDHAGNISELASATYSFDNTPPSVTIASNSDPGPSSNPSMTLTFTFSEPVTGFGAEDVILVNAAKGTFTSLSPSVYTLAISASDPSVSATVASDSATDTALNGNLASNSWSITCNYSFWKQEAYLKAPNATATFNTEFAAAVAISGDTIVIGAENESSGQTTITNGTGVTSSDTSKMNAGAAYVFKRTGNLWAREAYLKAPNADTFGKFGSSVSISGDTIVVGSEDYSNQTTITNGSGASTDRSATWAGSAYVFKRSGGVWANEAYLKAPNAESRDFFGGSVAISGDVIVVGAAGEDSNQTTITNGSGASADNSYVGWAESRGSAGAAYVFRRTGSAWVNDAYLKAPNNTSGFDFGNSVAISGDTIVVGSDYEGSSQTTITNGDSGPNYDNSGSSVGAAYVFKRKNGLWNLESYLKAPNADNYDVFGSSVAISGDTIVVGALNETSSQSSITNGTGASADNSMTRAGAAYVFKRTGNIWANEAYLKAPNNQGNSKFGIVSISGDTIVVGASDESSNQTTIMNGSGASSNTSAAGAGAAYVFRRNSSAWSGEAYLKASNAEAGDVFGSSVAISADTIVIGAPREDSNQTTITNGESASSNNSTTSAGAAYVFKRSVNSTTLSVLSVTPNSSVTAGHQVVISGQGFMGGASVTVGGAACSATIVQGPNEIICRLPSNLAGSKAIQVTNPNATVSNSNVTVNYQ